MYSLQAAFLFAMAVRPVELSVLYEERNQKIVRTLAALQPERNTYTVATYDRIEEHYALRPNTYKDYSIFYDNFLF